MLIKHIKNFVNDQLMYVRVKKKNGAQVIFFNGQHYRSFFFYPMSY